MFAETKYHSIFSVNRSLVQNALIVLLASVVLALVSQVAIHVWWPVPMTLQSAMVVLLGLTLGSKRAALAVVLYLCEGAIGLPVFAGGLGGLAILMGPSAGYLCGFLPAAFCAGLLMEKGMAKNIAMIFATAVLSTLIIFLFGFAHLQSLVGFQYAYIYGVKPFLFIEPVKLIAASVLAKLCWSNRK